MASNWVPYFINRFTGAATGKVLTLTSATTATWQTPSGGGGGSSIDGAAVDEAPGSPHADDCEFDRTGTSTTIPSGFTRRPAVAASISGGCS
jgi:hypothetical protein